METPANVTGSGDGPASSARDLPALDTVSLIYIGFPVILFVIGWLQIWASTIVLGALCVAFWRRFQSSKLQRHTVPAPAMRRDPAFAIDLALACFVALAFGACSGLGGLSYQFSDFPYYDGFLRDLIEFSWPLAYQHAGPQQEPLLAVYYFAYYLPAAFAGKLLGWSVAHFFIYLWVAVGLVLASLWLAFILKTRVTFAILLLLFFSGLDIVGRLVVHQSVEGHVATWYDLFTGGYWWSVGRGWLDHWMADFALFQGNDIMHGVFFKFYSLSSFLVDGPYHLVPGSVILLMIFHDIFRRDCLERVGLLYAFLPIASIFLALGAAPFVVWAVLRKRFAGAITFANLGAGVVLLSVMVLYFGSVVPGGSVSGWVWEFVDMSRASPYLLLFYVVEFGLYVAIVLSVPAIRQRGLASFMLIGLAIFLLAPLYRFGEYNDMTVKIVIPAQVVLITCVGFCLRDKTIPVRRMLLVGLLLIGAITPLGNILRAAEFGLGGGSPLQRNVRHANEVLPLELALQGKGDEDSLFWSVLAKEPTFAQTPPIPEYVSWNFGAKVFDMRRWFVISKKYNQSERGLEITSVGNQPLVRARIDEIQASRIGHVFVDASIQALDGSPVDGQLVLLWTHLEVADDIGAEWDFERYHSVVVYPPDRIVRSNPYWRGSINEIALYFKTDYEGECKVTIRRVAFLER